MTNQFTRSPTRCWSRLIAASGLLVALTFVIGCSSSQPDPAERAVNAANRADSAAARADAASQKASQAAAQAQAAASRVEQAAADSKAAADRAEAIAAKTMSGAPRHIRHHRHHVSAEPSRRPILIELGPAPPPPLYGDGRGGSAGPRGSGPLGTEQGGAADKP